MNRQVGKVAKEIAQLLKQRDGADSISSIQVDLTRWLLMLAPPKPRKIRPRDPIKGTKSPTKAQLDALCREIVFLRDKGECQMGWFGEGAYRRIWYECRRTDGFMDWAHILSRGANPRLRHDPMNSVVMCRQHHMQWHGMTGRKGQLSAEDYYVTKYGRQAWEELQRRAYARGKTDGELVRAHLEAERKKLA